MRRASAFALIAGAALAISTGARLAISRSPDEVFEPKPRPVQVAPLCPWREPESDLVQLFPGATRYQLETRILSGLRPEMATQLKRAPTAEENALHVYRVQHGDEVIGEIATRRVRGSHGAIELVIPVNARGGLVGLRLQRIREPESIEQAFKGAEWCEWFKGRTAESGWECEELVRQLPAEARSSAREIIEGVRSTMILLSISRQVSSPVPLAQHPPRS